MGRTELTIVVSCDGKKLRLDAVGDVDRLGGRQLLDTICTAVDLRCRDVSVDLGNARFADASAIEALVHAERRLRTSRVRLRILNPPEPIERDLRDLGLGGCLGPPAIRRQRPAAYVGFEGRRDEMAHTVLRP
jgi:anti-anti-sigma regulatory factor